MIRTAKPIERRRARNRALGLAAILVLAVLVAVALLFDSASGPGLRNPGTGASGEGVAVPETGARDAASAASIDGPSSDAAPAILAVPVAAEAAPVESAAPAAAPEPPVPVPPAGPEKPTALVVVTEAGSRKPVPGAPVAQVSGPLAPFRPDLEPSTATDGNGAVRLPLGECYVVIPPGFAARFVDLRKPPKALARTSVEVHRAVGFTGQVIDDRGIPLPGIPVQAGAILRLDRGSGSEADPHLTPACDAGRWTIAVTDAGGRFALGGIPAGQVLIEIRSDRWFFRDPPAMKYPVLAGPDPPHVLLELAPVALAAVAVRGLPTGAPVEIGLKLPSVPTQSRDGLPPADLEARRGLFADLRARVLRELASAGFPKEDTVFRAGVLAVRSSDAAVRPAVTIALPGAPGLPITTPIALQPVAGFDTARATVVDLRGADLGRLVPVRLRFRDEKGGAASWVPPLRLESGVITRPHRLPDAAALAVAGVVTLHLPPGVWDIAPDPEGTWREPRSFRPVKVYVDSAEVEQDVVLDVQGSVAEVTIEDPFGRELRGFEAKARTRTSSWDPDRRLFALLGRSGDRTLTAHNGRRWITITIPQHRLRSGDRAKVRVETEDPHEF